MNLYIMDPDTLDRLAIINDYSARAWNRVWGESGSFRLWAPVTPENEEFLVAENLIWPDDQKLVGVIESIHKYTEEGSNMPQVEISGRFITDCYLSRRIIWGNFLRKDVPSIILKQLIEEQSIGCSDLSRRFGSTISTLVSIDSSVPIQGTITYCNSYGNLWEEVKGISLEYGLDVEFEYRVDNVIPAISGSIYAGQNKAQEVNLSTDLGFLTSPDYLWDSTDYCNTALVAGEGEGADREIVSIIPSSATGRNRRELYVDARDLQKTSEGGTSMSDEEYTDSLTQRGNNKLLEFPLYETYECSLQLTGQEGYIFGVDYNLGDTVTLTDTILKVQVQARVKEHQFSEDKDGRVDVLVFGLAVPTITSLVKRRK